MMSKLNFRILVILCFTMTLFGAGFDLLFPNAIVDGVNDYIFEAEQEQDELTLITNLIFGSLTVCAVFVSVCGLIFFKPWARHLYVVSFLLVLPTYFTNGLYVLSGVAQLIYDLSMISSGVILALVYFCPVKNYFVKSGI